MTYSADHQWGFELFKKTSAIWGFKLCQSRKPADVKGITDTVAMATMNKTMLNVETHRKAARSL